MNGDSGTTRSIMWHGVAPPSAVGRILQVSYRATLPQLQELLGADVVELDLESLDQFDQAASNIHEMFSQADLPVPSVLIRVMTCVAETTREATRQFDRLVGRGSASHRSHVWFVGTEMGLLGLTRDLESLRIADGVSCVPVSQLAGQPSARATAVLATF